MISSGSNFELVNDSANATISFSSLSFFPNVALVNKKFGFFSHKPVSLLSNKETSIPNAPL